MAVSEERLRMDISENGRFGELPHEEGHGRTVLTGTDANRRARERLVSKLTDAGLAVSVDAVGNVVGRWFPPGCNRDAAPVATGSHLDSVPEGGIFDGPLGVYAGLEAVRSLQESNQEFYRPIDVVCFTEEEGQRFGNGLLGSSVATGQLSVADAHALTDGDGVRLADALEQIGFLGDSRIEASTWDSWLELHIEQGTRLQDEQAAAGIVTAITGITHCYIEITGEADHAGSTPMGKRSDAMAAASEMILELEAEAERLAETGSSTAVGTVGNVDVSPNATNVIPGTVRLGVDIRDIERESIEQLVSVVESVGTRIERERSVTVEVSRPYDISPEPIADRCQHALEVASEKTGIETIHMHSGAAHDTMNVSTVTDGGLLFAPSKAGISHNPREWTEWSDCANATRVLTAALAQLADQ
jgi:hydantoinase/carbamoylase family amidase